MSKQRLRELAIQTDSWCDQTNADPTSYNIEWEEKYGQLLIQECINIVKKRYMGDNNREDMEVLRCVEDLKKFLES